MKRFGQQYFWVLTLGLGLMFYAVSSLESPLGGGHGGPPDRDELEISLPIGQFEDGIDARGVLDCLPDGPTYLGPFYAWNDPYDSQDAHDDINYWDVISDGDGANEFADYHFWLEPPHDWSIFDTLQINLYADDGAAGDSPTGVEVFIHDADDIGNSEDNGYHYLGLITSVDGIYDLYFGDADQRDEIDDVLIRVRESYFDSIYTAGKQQTTYLFHIDVHGTVQDPQEPVFLGTGMVDPNDVSYLYAPSVMYDEREGLFKYWGCGTFTTHDHILYKEAASIDGLNNALLTTALYPAKFDGGDGTEFDYKHACDPNVIRVGSVYYLYYGGIGDDSLPEEERATAIGVATSTDGGRTFTRREEPIVALLPGTFVPGSYGVGQPAVVQAAPPDGNFYMVYTQQDGYYKQKLMVIRAAEPDFASYQFLTIAQPYSWSVEMVYDAGKNQFIIVHNYTDVDDLDLVRVVTAFYDTNFSFLTSTLAQRPDAGFAFGEGVALMTDSTRRLGWDFRNNLIFMGSTHDQEWAEPWPPATILGPHMQTTFASIEDGRKGTDPVPLLLVPDSELPGFPVRHDW